MPFRSLPSNRLPAPLAGAVNRLFQLDKLERLYDRARQGGELSAELLRWLGVRVEISPSDLARIPTTGSVVAVSNHPFGLLDGAILTDLLTRIRPDVRILVNRMLGELPELAHLSVFIDPFDRPEDRASNGRALRQALTHVKNGGMLLIFPAGEVSHFDLRAGAIRDPRWRSTTARLARIAGARVLPVFVRGANSLPFQVLGMVHPRLRTAALPAELLNKRGKVVEVRIGGLIEPSELASMNDEAATGYLRLRTELLARRESASGGAPADAAPVAEARPADEVARELASLPASCLLEEARELAVYLTDAAQAPLALDEIGRLREIAFRAAGEGTGQPRDLDRFDPHYLHLFLWNREKREIVGAYRIGEVPKLLARFGRKGLYTNTLFHFDRDFPRSLGPSLELGRSFVRPEYQRQFAPLLLLWKGIGAYVARHPEYCTLIGAVSVSNQYSQASRELIARYFEMHVPGTGRRAVIARHPLRGRFARQSDVKTLCSFLRDAEGLSAPIADLEPDGKGLPILVKQYVKLGGRMLAFSVDPRFGNTLDGFVTVDLRTTQPEILARYMGKEKVRRFLAWHKALRTRAA